MNKREFLKGSGVLMGSGLISRMGVAAELALEPKAEPRTNWSGNYTYSTDQVDMPGTLEAVQQLMGGSERLKALGSRHSFDGIADTTGAQVQLGRMKEMTIDRAAKTVTVGAGVRYGDVAPYLDKEGFALHNLASLPHITVAGATATGTHGSGVKNGNLATAVTALELVTPDSKVVTLTKAKDGERFRAAVVGLGGLGIVTRVTLALQPTFEMTQVVYKDLPFSVLEHHLEDVFASGYSVSLFTDWQEHRATQVWVKSKYDPKGPSPVKADLFGAKPAKQDVHPLAGHSAENTTKQMGVPGPWYERMPHFRMNFTPSSGQELQTEYFVPREKGYHAILAVEELRDEITPHLFITELRRIAPDDLWMSMAYQRDSMAIHFTWKPEWDAVKLILPKIEAKLAPFGPRPHWAKLFTMDPATVRAAYPKMGDFQAQLKQYDPQSRFRNAFLERNVYGA